MVPLDELFADEQYGLGGSELAFDGPAQDEIVPQFLEECRVNGHYYALPYMRSTEACYVNKTYVEALGFTLPEDTLTWDFVWQVSEAAAATKGNDGVYGVNGQEVLLPFIYKSTDNMMIQMLRQLDAGYSTASGDIQLFNDTTKTLLLDIADHTAGGPSPPSRSPATRPLFERRAVHLCGGFHRRRHLDGYRRPAGGHCRGKYRPLRDRRLPGSPV